MPEPHEMYPRSTLDLAEKRRRLAPGPADTFRAFSQSVFADGALPQSRGSCFSFKVQHTLEP